MRDCEFERDSELERVRERRRERERESAREREREQYQRQRGEDTNKPNDRSKPIILCVVAGGYTMSREKAGYKVLTG